MEEYELMSDKIIIPNVDKEILFSKENENNTTSFIYLFKESKIDMYSSFMKKFLNFLNIKYSELDKIGYYYSLNENGDILLKELAFIGEIRYGQKIVPKKDWLIKKVSEFKNETVYQIELI